MLLMEIIKVLVKIESVLFMGNGTVLNKQCNGINRSSQSIIPLVQDSEF
jgi:hypothetical protein